MSQSTECRGSVVPLAISYHVSLFITFGDVVLEWYDHHRGRAWGARKRRWYALRKYTICCVISKAQLRSSSFWARMERILRQQRAQSFKEFRRLFIVTGLTVVFALLDIFVAVAFWTMDLKKGEEWTKSFVILVSLEVQTVPETKPYLIFVTDAGTASV